MHTLENPSDLQYLAIFAISVLSAARIARLIVHDHLPLAEWIRDVWDKVTGRSGWNLLLHCHVCFTVWSAFGVLLWGYFTDWNTVWWLVNVGLAVAYAAMYVVTFDGVDD